MREIMLSIVVAFSVTAHLAMAVAPNYGYGSYGGFPGGTHLVGRDGLCLEMFSWVNKGTYFPTRLSPCNERKKQTQLWAVVQDGTIRPMSDKYCLVSYFLLGATTTNVIVRECEKESIPNKIWNHKKDGTIVHVGSGMVLTGKSNNVYVTIEKNENTPSQSWVATKSLSPTVANIKWLDNLCLQSTKYSNHVGLDRCTKENNNQRWALYGDGTIRQNVNTDYCLTSSKEDLGHYIVVSKCQDIPQQRWGLNAEDNTINHPANTDMVMDVFSIPFNGILPTVIVMSHRDGSPSQRWTIY